MKLVSFVLLVGGWAIVVAALLLLPAALSRHLFVLAGMAVEILGFSIAVHSHRITDVERG